MKSSTIKRTVLAVLVLVAGYIWWGNLRSFQSSIMPNPPEQPAANNVEPGDKTRGQIAYVEPKVNPFQNKPKPDLSQPVRPPVSRNERPTSRNAPPPPSARCTLKGLVKELETPQAIIVFDDRTSVVLSVSDSLDTWQLVTIRDNLVVFKQEKAYDTLWLEGTKP